MLAKQAVAGGHAASVLRQRDSAGCPVPLSRSMGTAGFKTLPYEVAAEKVQPVGCRAPAGPAGPMQDA